jgi:hypothetical protein
MAVNAALHTAKAPNHVPITTIRKNISSNLILSAAANTSAQDLSHHLDAIKQAAQTVHRSLQPPRLNEKWYKLAVHGIPTEQFPDTEDGMHLLQGEIERSNYPTMLAQLPCYMSRPEKRVGKAASSVVIVVLSQEELSALRRNRVRVLYEPRKVTEYFSARKSDQWRRCQKLGHHHTACKTESSPVCGFCAQNHPTEKHHCPRCPDCHGKSCSHTEYKCANCAAAGHPDTAYAASASRCPIKTQALREAWKTTKPTHTTSITPNTNDADTTMTTHA